MTNCIATAMALLKRGWVLLVLAAAGCAGLPSGMEAPSITISDFGVGSVSLFEQQFNLRLRVQNPNTEDLRVDGIAFDLEINGEPFAKGVGNQAVLVPRFGSGFIAVEAVSTLGSMLKQFGKLMSDQPGFKYRIKGTLSIGGGTRIPFDRRGEFDTGLTGSK